MSDTNTSGKKTFYKILVVEDDEGLRRLVQKELERNGIITECVKTGNDAISWGIKNQHSLMILDYKLPDISANDVIKCLIDKNIENRFIIMTGHGDIKVAVDMMKLGVKDYIIKDANFLELLPAAVKRAIDDFEKERKLINAEDALKSSEEGYRLLAESVLDVIWKTDMELKFTYVSQAVERLLGYKPEKLHNVEFNKILAKDSVESAEDFFKKIIKNQNKTNGKNHYMLELEQLREDGKSVWTELSVSLLMDSKKAVGFLGVTRDISERKNTQKKLDESFIKLRKALEASVQAMGKATEIKDPYTAGHQRRVGILSYEIAKVMGLDEDICDGVRLAGAIHDIGKIYVPAEILSKPGLISENELNIIKSHPQVGHDILRNIEFPWPIAKIILQHHERIDGSGYPLGLKGDKILIEAKIIGVADVVEAMASHRPYRPALGLNLAIEEIEKNKGKSYDSDIVDACIKIITTSGLRFD